MSQPLKLYHYWRSSSSWRVRLALAIKKIECEFVPVNLLTGENDAPAHLARNPLGYVPTLEIQSDSGKPKYLNESLAIIGWLDRYQPEPGFSLPLNAPDALYLNAKALELAQIINADTQPVQNLTVLELLSERFGADEKARADWARVFIERGFHAFEKLLPESATESFAVGSRWTLADLCLIPQIYNAARFQVDLSQFPKIQSLHLNYQKTAEYQASCPERYEPKKL